MLNNLLFNFITGYVTYLCDNHPEVIDGSSEYVHYDEQRKPSINLTEQDAATLLMGKCDLSQRAYKNLKRILK